MCLVALALGQSDRFPLVLAANRDEYFERRSAPLEWWTPPGQAAPILSGRDLQGGGTWLGLSEAGRLALVTNVRSPAGNVATAPSRGALVPRWLAGDLPFDAYWREVSAGGYNGFNVVAADVARGAWLWASNAAATPRALGPGLYGLSNAALDTPWPKTVRLKEAMRSALARASAAEEPVDALAARLFEALADPSMAATMELPSTGIPVALERQLSAVFIRTPDGRYGTRCSTLVISERVGTQAFTQVFERSFDADPAASPTMRRTLLADWPKAASAG
jgi:uncharacterized protein with NRDE domain